MDGVAAEVWDREVEVGGLVDEQDDQLPGVGVDVQNVSEQLGRPHHLVGGLVELVLVDFLRVEDVQGVGGRGDLGDTSGSSEDTLFWLYFNTRGSKSGAVADLVVGE